MTSEKLFTIVAGGFIFLLLIAGPILDNRNNETIENEPGVTLTINANNPVIIKNGHYSNDTITVTVSKTTNSNHPINYIVEYEPSHPDYLFIVESETYAKKENWVLEPLTNSGSFKNDQIKIYGEKMMGQKYSPWTVKVNLLYHNKSLIMSRIINVNVTTVVE